MEGTVDCRPQLKCVYTIDTKGEIAEWMRITAIKQLALFPEIITGVPGLSQQIRESGGEVIKPEHRKFFRSSLV
jgi:hypothetical protein